MINLSGLPQIKTKSKKRVGRGAGSGKGKTSGRGQKGQAARGKIKLLFEGGQLSLIKRLPLLRGKGKNKSRGNKPLVINLKYLNLLPDKSIIDMDTLIKNKIIKEEFKNYPLKILGDGELTKALTVKLPVSHGAEKKIIAAGGKIENQDQKSKKAKKQLIK